MSLLFKRALSCTGLTIALAATATGDRRLSTPPPATGPQNAEIEQRITGLIARMTLEEKVLMLGGVDEMNTHAIPRLGIPSIRMNDGPLGVRVPERTTAFPAGIAMGASFDGNLIREVAKAIADETRTLGHNMLLGPCVNLSRNPFGGRNFESFGEDPFLSSVLGASYVRGVQGQNVLASVKHFALNEQEEQRMSIDVHADVRTMFEMHFPMFKAAIDAGSWTVMASYNKVNGHHATENDFLLNQVLKRRWNFQGFVVSDWDATHSVVEAANAGLDLEMPWGKYFGEQLVAAVRAGRVRETVIDDKVRRLLRAMFVIGLIDPSLAPAVPPPLGPDSEEHHALALRLAQESAVLLKNESHILPLRPRGLHSVAVIGPNAAKARTGGGGSSHVDAIHAKSPLQALQGRLGRTLQLKYARGATLPNELDLIPGAHLRPAAGSGEAGLRAEYFDNRDLRGTPRLVRTEEHVELDGESLRASGLEYDFSVRWTGYLSVPDTGSYKLWTLSDDGVRLSLDGRMLIDNWTDHGPSTDVAEVKLEAGRQYAIRLEYYQAGGYARMSLGWTMPYKNLVQEAVEAARGADVAVIFAGMGDDESEGFDRPHMNLPDGQDALIQAVAAANPNTVVVLTGGNPVSMGAWLPKVKGLLHVWYPGQHGAEAAVDLLTGVVNPSGKLPVTFLKRWEDSPAYGNYPGRNGRVDYAEGLFIGYRHFDARNVQPEFPFGFGLSYTGFAYEDLRVRWLDDSPKTPRAEITFRVTNTGSVEGADVAQVYVGELRPAVVRPVKELKGFQKVRLQPGESREVTVELNPRSFSYFDAQAMRWRITPGKFLVSVGNSSRDLPLSTELEIGGL